MKSPLTTRKMSDCLVGREMSSACRTSSITKASIFELFIYSTIEPLKRITWHVSKKFSLHHHLVVKLISIHYSLKISSQDSVKDERQKNAWRITVALATSTRYLNRIGMRKSNYMRERNFSYSSSRHLRESLLCFFYRHSTRSSLLSSRLIETTAAHVHRHLHEQQDK
jgi:hypothetical protein